MNPSKIARYNFWSENFGNFCWLIVGSNAVSLINDHALMIAVLYKRDFPCITSLPSGCGFDPGSPIILT